MTHLFEPLTLRSMTVKNRLWLAPMCQYQAREGVANEWHRVHYGARAAGGFGLLTIEATGVVPEGRISPACLGLWNDDQAQQLAPIVDFAHSQGAKVAIQLNHAGRKASMVPWLPNQRSYPTQTIPAVDGGWQTVAPSAITTPDLLPPCELGRDEIRQLPEHFAAAARRAVAAGVDAIEIHAAHGYLLHQFLSPVANQRTDSWGGSFENRTRLVLLVATAVRAAVGEDMPIIVRISATDWLDDQPAWDLEQSVSLTRLLAQAGVDLISVSTGGLVPAQIPVGPNYQVRFAEAITRQTGVPTGAAGLITQSAQAEAILAEGRANTVYIGRQALRDPAWPLRAAHELGHRAEDIDYPQSYWRGIWPDPS